MAAGFSIPLRDSQPRVVSLTSHSLPEYDVFDDPRYLTRPSVILSWSTITGWEECEDFGTTRHSARATYVNDPGGAHPAMVAIRLDQRLAVQQGRDGPTLRSRTAPKQPSYNRICETSRRQRWDFLMVRAWSPTGKAESSCRRQPSKSSSAVDPDVGQPAE